MITEVLSRRRRSQPQSLSLQPEEEEEEEKKQSDAPAPKRQRRNAPSASEPVAAQETLDEALARQRYENDSVWCQAVSQQLANASVANQKREALIAHIKNQSARVNGAANQRKSNAVGAADEDQTTQQEREMRIYNSDTAQGALMRDQRKTQARVGLVAEMQRIRQLSSAAFKKEEAAGRHYSRRYIASDRLRDAGRSKGWTRFYAILARLDTLGFTRSNLQKELHKSFVVAILPLIFKDEWAEAKEEAFALFGITCIQSEVLARTARRMGKTASVAMFTVAVLENCPGIKICIFSTGQRASSALMTEIKRLLKKVPNGLERIVKETQEELRFAPVAVGTTKAEKRAAELSDDVSVLYSYPGGTTSKLQSHRHVGG